VVVTVDAGLGNIARDCRVQIIPKGLYAKHGLDPAGLAASTRKFLGR
jgi:hypothetical protein